jgi:hypothetical protein
MENATLVRRIVTASFACALIAAFTGCASFNRIAHYPKPKQDSTVSIADTPMGKMSELPIGVYYDKDNQVIVTGHQKGLGAGMLFGVIGVVVADQMNKSSGSSKYGAEAAKGADLAAMLDELVVASIAEARAPHWTKAVGDGQLRLTPYAVFTVDKSGDARLHAMIRAELPAENGKPVWSGRYFARAMGEHPLQDAGWMANDRFPQSMRAALGRALNACIDDSEGRLMGTSPVTAKGRFPYLNMNLELRAIAVREEPDYIIAKLAVGDAMVMAGTHVLDRADYEIKPAKFKDPRQ